MIEHVWRRARKAKCFSRLIVATDDARILEVVRGFGGDAVMTPRTCASGTDRLAWVARKLACDAVVNIQGDEPFLHAGDLEQMVEPLRRDKKLQMSTLAAPLDPEDLSNPKAVKVVCDARGDALYFSRAPIPFARDGRPEKAKKSYWLHLGFYAYRRSFLLKFAQWPATELEQLEQLEQLRVLVHGHAIRVVRVKHPTLAIDTPADLERARALMGKSKGN